MKLRKILLLAMMAALPVAGIADDGVLLVLNSGETVGFAFSEKPVIVTGENLLIKTAATEVTYPYSGVKHVEFGEVPTANAIDKVTGDKAGKVFFKLSDGGVDVSGLSNGELVSVYTVDGREVASAKAGSGSSVCISLPAGSRSVYVVRTSSGVSFKFVNK